MYKVVFCGTTDFSVKILESLEKINVEICGVISQTNKITGRKKEMTKPPVALYAEQKNYKLFQPNRIIEIQDELKNINPDFLVTCAYGQIIPEKILGLFNNCINIHSSLLPKYRGGSPIQYSIMNGDLETGITIMKMVKQMDAGEMYKQESLPIDPNDNHGSLSLKLSILAQQMIEKYLIDIFDKKITGIAQNEEEVTFAYNLTNEQEKINFNKTSIEVINFIKSQAPKPVAFAIIEGSNERIKIQSARLLDDDDIFPVPLKIYNPGEVVAITKKGVVVKTLDSFIMITELQRSGKKMVDAKTLYCQNNFALPIKFTD